MTRSMASSKSCHLHLLALSFAGGQQGRLVDEIGQIGAHETRGPGGNLRQVHVRRQRDVLGVHPEDLLPSLQIGAVE